MSGKNGATIVVPKSHLTGKYTNRLTKKFKVINANPGDVLILDSRTWHEQLKIQLINLDG